MKKVFSYSLFEPKIMPEHRFWDKQKNNTDRYWYNIPAISIINSIIYPEYENVFYVSKNIWRNPISEIFNICSNIRCETIEKDYSLTEPAIWRMIPLWDPTIDLLCTRDVDSLTTIDEFKYLLEFDRSDCLLGTIRSHQNHYGVACRMLAGLSSFKANKIPLDIKGLNYELYYGNRIESYGSDQELLIKTFTENEQFTRKYFLDGKVDLQKNKQDFPCKVASFNEYQIKEEQKRVLKLIRNKTGTKWLGEPCDSRGELLAELLKSNNKMREDINKNKILKNFYKV